MAAVVVVVWHWIKCECWNTMVKNNSIVSCSRKWKCYHVVQNKMFSLWQLFLTKSLNQFYREDWELPTNFFFLSTVYWVEQCLLHIKCCSRQCWYSSEHSRWRIGFQGSYILARQTSTQVKKVFWEQEVQWRIQEEVVQLNSNFRWGSQEYVSGE